MDFFETASWGEGYIRTPWESSLFNVFFIAFVLFLLNHMPHKAVKITAMSCLLRKNIITFLSSMVHIAEWRGELGEALEVFGLTLKRVCGSISMPPQLQFCEHHVHVSFLNFNLNFLEIKCNLCVVCAPVWRLGTMSGDFLRHSPPYSSRQDFSVNPEHHHFR